MNTGYKIKSELSEAQIEADVASYLGYITPFWSKRFRLISIDEQTTGSDKLFNRFVPIYLQFKVSEGLKPLDFGFNLLRKSGLQKIRAFRRKNDINSDPTLYFKLRDQAPTARDFQHNILKSFHQPPYQYAMYVAPLTLSLDEYNKSLEVSFIDRFLTFNPFFFRNQDIEMAAMKQSLGINPFLRGHISIPPHEIVDTSNHYYSFSRSGGDLAWHSGEKLNDDLRLSNQIKKIFQIAYRNKDVGHNKATYIQFISQYFDSVEKVDNPIDIIEDFSYYLKNTFNIKLLFLHIDD